MASAHPDRQQPLVVRSTKPQQGQHPRIKQARSAVLKDTNRSRKEAVHWVIVDEHSGEVHHEELSLKTWEKSKSNGVCSVKPQNTISLSTEEDDEIGKLREFLSSLCEGAVPDDPGKYVVMRSGISGNPASLQDLLRNVSARGQADALTAVLRKAVEDPALFLAVTERAASDPLLFTETAAALNLAAYTDAVAELKRLIEGNALEGEFQRLLTRHPWMFGSEYSELLDRRQWTRDEKQDFVVRRTTDGYIELIEIKRPLGGKKLFNHDRDHDSYYAGAELSEVVGQVQKYVEILDQDHDRIVANDSEDTTKIRAKVIIGRDGDKAQQAALRRFNGHLFRIEVITFDQLRKITENVLSYLKGSLRPIASEPGDDW
ncbi:MAG: Shedu anti-phage system protein SduA domain-containing protein [Planctomycetaceae bacterium]